MATLFSLEEIAAWREIEIKHGIVSTVLSGVVGVRGGKDQRNEEKNSFLGKRCLFRFRLLT